MLDLKGSDFVWSGSPTDDYVPQKSPRADSIRILHRDDLDVEEYVSYPPVDEGSPCLAPSSASSISLPAPEDYCCQSQEVVGHGQGEDLWQLDDSLASISQSIAEYPYKSCHEGFTPIAENTTSPAVDTFSKEQDSTPPPPRRPGLRVHCRTRHSQSKPFTNDSATSLLYTNHGSTRLPEVDEDYLSDTCEERIYFSDGTSQRYDDETMFLRKLASFFREEGEGEMCLACYRATTGYLASDGVEIWEIEQIHELKCIVRCPLHTPDTFGDLCRRTPENCESENSELYQNEALESHILAASDLLQEGGETDDADEIEEGRVGHVADFVVDEVDASLQIEDNFELGATSHGEPFSDLANVPNPPFHQERTDIARSATHGNNSSEDQPYVVKMPEMGSSQDGLVHTTAFVSQRGRHQRTHARPDYSTLKELPPSANMIPRHKQPAQCRDTTCPQCYPTEENKGRTPTHEKGAPPFCAVCNVVFTSRSEVYDHLSMPPHYVCSSGITLMAAKAETSADKRKKMVRCRWPGCGQQLSMDSNTIKKHMTDKHIEARLCHESCGKWFANPSSLRKHVSTCKSDEAKLPCNAKDDPDGSGSWSVDEAEAPNTVTQRRRNVAAGPFTKLGGSCKRQADVDAEPDTHDENMNVAEGSEMHYSSNFQRVAVKRRRIRKH